MCVPPSKAFAADGTQKVKKNVADYAFSHMTGLLFADAEAHMLTGEASVQTRPWFRN